jgi:F0F1-type ATP synthase membrane subunit c/vacuolar-type H+-ATPase subunit K
MAEPDSTPKRATVALALLVMGLAMISLAIGFGLIMGDAP